MGFYEYMPRYHIDTQRRARGGPSLILALPCYRAGFTAPGTPDRKDVTYR